MSMAEQTRQISGKKLLRKTGSALAFVLQLFVVGLVPVLDARQEAAGLASYSHVEEPGNSGCVPTHDPFNCQLCRVLTTPESPAQATRVVVIEKGTQLPPLAVELDVARVTWRGTVSTRGPPQNI